MFILAGSQNRSDSSTPQLIEGNIHGPVLAYAALEPGRPSKYEAGLLKPL